MVLELYGTGTAPARREGLLDALRTARKHGVLVVATSQCARGGVVLATYEVGRKLEEAGVIAAGDLTTEAAATKLAYLFGRYPGDVDKVRELVSVSLRGELSHPDVYLRPFFEDRSLTGDGARISRSNSMTAPPVPEGPPKHRSFAAPDPAPPSPRPRARDVALGVALGAGLALWARRRGA